MVSSISGTSRAIFALCSLIAARGGFAGAEAVQSDLEAAVQNGFESTGPAQSGFEGAGAVQADISACLNKAGVFVSVPTTSSWVLDTEAWNSRVSPKPSGVVFPKTEEQVTAALKCAASAGVKVTTLGGNRSFSSLGFGRNDGALVMNLKHMKNLKYDESTQLLSFGGPVMISEAVNYLWKKYGRTLPHGRCPDVGMTGVVISGFGTLSRECGTMLDNLRSIRVALADGSIVDADANQNSDLFWGVRGATSSLGVVLVFKIKTFAPPSQRVTDYTIGFKSDIKPTQQDNVDALIGMQNWAMSNDNNDLLSIRYNLRTNSTLQGFYYGSGANAKLVLGSLMKKLPASMALISNEEDFYASENISTPGIVEQTLTPRRYFYITSVTIPEDTPLTNATAWSLFANSAYAPKLPDAVVSGFVDMWGGKYTKRVRADDSAWKHDNNLLLVRLDMRSSAFDVKFADSSLSTMRDRFYKFVDDYKVSGGVPGSFPTYRDDKLTVPEMAEYLYGGGNYQKLQKIKTKYDSMEMFNTDPQAIPALKATS